MYDHTSVIIPHNASNSVPCEKWEYDTSVYQSTIVTEVSTNAILFYRDNLLNTIFYHIMMEISIIISTFLRKKYFDYV